MGELVSECVLVRAAASGLDTWLGPCHAASREQRSRKVNRVLLKRILKCVLVRPAASWLDTWLGA